jgi:hypothetical protein
MLLSIPMELVQTALRDLEEKQATSDYFASSAGTKPKREDQLENRKRLKVELDCN